MKVEVHAVGLRTMRQKRELTQRLTQRKLAHELGISENYIPAIEAGAGKGGPKAQEQLV